MTEERPHDLDADDPFDALGLPDTATEGEVRSAYRALLKLHRPERDPEGFQKLRAAYDQALAMAGWGRVDPADDPESSGSADDGNPAKGSARDDLEYDGDVELPYEPDWDDDLIEALRPLIEKGDAAGVEQHLAEVRSQRRDSDPDRWIWVLCVCADKAMAHDLVLARALLEEASSMPLEDGRTFDMVENLRAAYPALLSLRDVRDRKIPRELIEFLKEHWDSAGPPLVDAFAEFSKRMVWRRKWSPSDVLERLGRAARPAAEMFVHMRQRLAEATWYEAVIARGDQEGLEDDLIAELRRIRTRLFPIVVVAWLWALGGLGAVIWGLLAVWDDESAFAIYDFGEIRMSILVLAVGGTIAIMPLLQFYRRLFRPRLKAALVKRGLVPDTLGGLCLHRRFRWGPLLRPLFHTIVVQDAKLLFECMAERPGFEFHDPEDEEQSGPDDADPVSGR